MSLSGGHLLVLRADSLGSVPWCTAPEEGPLPPLECWEAWKQEEGRKRERERHHPGWSWGTSLDEEGSRRSGVNRPSLSQQDRAKWEFSSRFSDFDLKKAALPDK